MKKAFKKMVIALALPILGVIAYTASAQDQQLSGGNADCNSYCESSTIYHCLLTYTDGSQVICLNMQVKGTQPPGN